ncbi:hypothetical protein AURANDRAFT_61279 [Aureococcus anophagefferens]|uniref:ABM domain-containing protein n=1 Tax=Aureococcus anophagefferens TaxID=44056 RepID=F0XXQ6_AURAN|nr:hypothetical protein AURANDRAFT_61279 [Aureococcus anophagefferens]EGB11986.1 hypothetical protein AURANDRAFT_61279 [Aureococcus anophagefferens]|eukprot:XP_009033088.1 hypothetical protein AURANDRAFT_61279 [Aureococcus anophagefferens]
MLRRVDDADAADDVNYVSATVWETKANFDAWKKGDAFKEAHGGGTVAGVAGMLVATLQNTKGKPKVAAWEGLLPLGLPGAPPADGEGWRRVAADGEATLPSDVFVAMNRFPVAEGSEDEFERRFADRSSTLADFAGFKGFLLLRRDDKVDDGATHSTFSVWDSRASFQAWLDSEKKPDEQPRKNLLAGRPTPSYYEGILALDMVDANAMDATLARSERLSMYQLRCDAREREVAELEARSRLPRDVLELPAAPLADVRSSYENLSNVAAVKAENDELRRRLDALEAARCAPPAPPPPAPLAPAALAPAALAPAVAAPPPAPAAVLPAAPPPTRAPSTEDVENQRLRDSGLQRSKEQYDQLEKQLRLARLEMSTHRERQWQRIYVSR